ncbi:MAG: prepilin-type N-terminal cleavage/methylation domain-containing protein [Chthonomonas sp.]|nr:prepilin-type N-terminal cleavage/methylation domain-containing protein [Chthonomonas sp.]
MTSSKANSRRAAFTLLELSVVVVIIAVITGAVAPAVGRWKTGADLRQFYARAQALASESRELAVRQRTTLRLTVEGESVVLRSGVTEEEEGQAVRTLTLPDNVSLSSATRQATTETTDGFVISYYPDGSSDGGTLTFESDGSPRALRVDKQGRADFVASDAPETGEGETWSAGDLEVRSG